MPVNQSSERFSTDGIVNGGRRKPERLLSYSGKVGSTVNLGVQAVQVTPGASSTCTGTACCCSSCCCW
jgi:hypothetical protein